MAWTYSIATFSVVNHHKKLWAVCQKLHILRYAPPGPQELVWSFPALYCRVEYNPVPGDSNWSNLIEDPVLQCQPDFRAPKTRYFGILNRGSGPEPNRRRWLKKTFVLRRLPEVVSSKTQDSSTPNKPNPADEVAHSTDLHRPSCRVTF